MNGIDEFRTKNNLHERQKRNEPTWKTYTVEPE